MRGSSEAPRHRIAPRAEARTATPVASLAAWTNHEASASGPWIARWAEAASGSALVPREMSERPLVEDGFLASLGSSQGERLPPEVEARMASLLGWDLAQVRIHRDATAAAAADALHAHAFALGADLFFGAGSWAPGTLEGDRVLVHELTHVVQFEQGRLPSTPGLSVSSPSEPAEQEAYAAESLVGGRMDTGPLAGLAGSAADLGAGIFEAGAPASSEGAAIHREADLPSSPPVEAEVVTGAGAGELWVEVEDLLVAEEERAEAPTEEAATGAAADPESTSEPSSGESPAPDAAAGEAAEEEAEEPSPEATELVGKLQEARGANDRVFFPQVLAEADQLLADPECRVQDSAMSLAFRLARFQEVNGIASEDLPPGQLDAWTLLALEQLSFQQGAEIYFALEAGNIPAPEGMSDQERYAHYMEIVQTKVDEVEAEAEGPVLLTLRGLRMGDTFTHRTEVSGEFDDMVVALRHVEAKAATDTEEAVAEQWIVEEVPGSTHASLESWEDEDVSVDADEEGEETLDTDYQGKGGLDVGMIRPGVYQASGKSAYEPHTKPGGEAAAWKITLDSEGEIPAYRNTVREEGEDQWTFSERVASVNAEAGEQVDDVGYYATHVLIHTGAFGEGAASTSCITLAPSDLYKVYVALGEEPANWELEVKAGDESATGEAAVALAEEHGKSEDLENESKDVEDTEVSFTLVVVDARELLLAHPRFGTLAVEELRDQVVR